METMEWVERSTNNYWFGYLFMNKVGHDEVGAVDGDEGALISEALHFVNLGVHGNDHVAATAFDKLGYVSGKESVDCPLFWRTG